MRLLLLSFLLTVLSAAQAAETQALAKQPPLGWNSWNCYGIAVTEAQVRENADYMAKHLKPHGWEYIIVDLGWYLPPEQTTADFVKDPKPAATLDAYGRLTPDLRKFPSAAGGKGLKPLADYVHSLGLKFGIHIMRGIPFQAIDGKLPIKGSQLTCDAIYKSAMDCDWYRGMRGVDVTKDTENTYYRSLSELYASWEVDYIKADDISRPYHTNEIAALSRAIKGCGRPIVLSLSPGAAPVAQAGHLKQHANLWRISPDFWDDWKLLRKQFDLCRDWQEYVQEGAWPDCDMLPLGKLRIAGADDYSASHIGLTANQITNEFSRFSDDEKQTMMSLWSIFRSPLMFGGNMPENNAQINALLTNELMISINQKGLRPRELRRTGDGVIWTSRQQDSTALNVALFNLGDTTNISITVAWEELGLKGPCTVRDVWTRKGVETQPNGFTATIRPHGSGFYRLTPLPAPVARPVSGENLLLVNPSFETAKGGFRNGRYEIEGWEGHNGRYGVHGGDTAAPGAGERAWKMEHAGKLVTTEAARASVLPNRRYTLSYQGQKTKNNPKAPGSVSTAIVWFDEAGKELGKTFSPSALGGEASSQWKTVSTEAQAPTGAVRAGIEVSAAGGGYPHEDGRTYVLDDFKLIFTGEPEDKIWARVLPLFIEPGKSASLTIPYRITAPRELAVRLCRDKKAYPEVRVKLDGPTRADAILAYPVPAEAAAGEDYVWDVRLLPVGGAWEKPLKQRRAEHIFLDQKENGSGEIAADHPAIIYEGRWDRSNPKAPSAFWMGSAFHVRFGGTSLKLICDITNTFANDQNLSLHVSIDGGPFTTVKGNREKNQCLTLASGLQEGLHTARILRNGPENVGFWRLHTLQLDAGRGLARHAPFRADRRIEAYGDSTVSGGDGGMYPNYTTTTARGLNASINCVSKGGSGVGGSFIFNSNALYYWDRLSYNVFYDARLDIDGNGKIDKDEPYHRNPYQPSEGLPPVPPVEKIGPAWGPATREAYGDPLKADPLQEAGRFTAEPKDVVIIGYGQNDQFVSGDKWVPNLRQLVTLLRKVYPKAHIFLTMTCMTGNTGFIAQAHNPIIADTAPGGLNADGHVHSVLLYPSGANGHPSVKQHHDMAHGNVSWRGLIDVIGETMDW